MFWSKLMKYSFITNISFLIMHEMDAIFWKEWRIFGLRDDVIGLNVFIIAHLPICIIILSGLTELKILYGKIVSLSASSFLIIHFFLHYKALSENIFSDEYSFGIIGFILIISIIQLVSTLLSLKQNRLRRRI